MPAKAPLSPARAAVRLNVSQREGVATDSGRSADRNGRITADTPARAGDPLEVELTRLARDYGRWITANQLATEEGCSIDTARRHALAGAYGLPVDRQPGGGVRILTTVYISKRRSRALNRKT